MPWNPKENAGTVTSHQGVTTRDRGWLWRVVKGVPSRQGGWRVIKGCRVVTESDLDESSRGDDSLQRVTLTSREGCAESSTKGDESSRVAESLQRVTLMSREGVTTRDLLLCLQLELFKLPLSQLLWITSIPWHSKVKITSYCLCN